jgi:bis(5'-nucleosidyl)-tetraphosphatase
MLPNPLTGVTEHDEFRWVTYDEASRLLVPRVRLVLDWAENRLLHDRDLQKPDAERQSLLG